MSRIGKNPIIIPEGVSVEISENIITVKGKLGEISQEYSNVEISETEGILSVSRKVSQRKTNLNMDFLEHL
jgi:large subunit ribosomal protein L6